MCLYIVISILGLIKPKTIKFVFVAFLLIAQYKEVRTEIDCLGVRIMCPNDDLCRSVYCCYIKLLIQISNPAYWYCTMQIVSAAGLLVPDGSIRPVVSALALKWFIIYSIHILYRNWEFLSHVIIIKTKILLSQAYLSFFEFWLSCLSSTMDIRKRTNNEVTCFL